MEKHHRNIVQKVNKNNLIKKYIVKNIYKNVEKQYFMTEK